MTERSPRSEVGILPERFVAVILAADLFTLDPKDMDNFDRLCTACEQIKDSELDAMRETT